MNILNKVFITIILSTIFYSINAQVLNEKTGVLIYYKIGEETFPDSWKTDEINAKGISLDTIEIERSMKIIKNALAKYPRELIKSNLKKIYILKMIEFYGQEFGGTNSSDAVYITNGGENLGYTNGYIEQTFHHEFSSILLRNYSNLLKREEWISNNALPYGDGGVQALKESKDSQDIDTMLNSKGFISQYATSDFENDFNTFAENLFYPSDEFYNAVKNYPKIRQKLDLILEFYFALDNTLTKKYFEKLYCSNNH